MDNSYSHSLDVEREADAFFQSLLTEAKHVPGDHGIPHEDVQVGSTVAELAKFQEGRTFHHKYFAACILAKGFGGMGTFAVERMTSIVRRAGFSTETRKAIAVRTFGAFVRANLWLDPEIEDKVSKPAQDVYKLRRVHVAFAEKLATVPPRPPPKSKTNVAQVADAIREDMASVLTPNHLPLLQTSTPSLIMSQLDMVLLGTTPFIVLDVRPQAVGLENAVRSREYDSYVYYHGILLRYLGVEDRFNFAIHPNPTVRRAISLRIWNNIVLPCWKHFSMADLEDFCHLMEVAVNPELAFHFFIKHVAGIGPADNTKKYINWFEKILLTILAILLALLFYPPARWIANGFMRLVFVAVRAFLHAQGYKAKEI